MDAATVVSVSYTTGHDGPWATSFVTGTIKTWPNICGNVFSEMLQVTHQHGIIYIPIKNITSIRQDNPRD